MAAGPREKATGPAGGLLFPPTAWFTAAVRAVAAAWRSALMAAWRAAAAVARSAVRAAVIAAWTAVASMVAGGGPWLRVSAMVACR